MSFTQERADTISLAAMLDMLDRVREQVEDGEVRRINMTVVMKDGLIVQHPTPPE